MSTGRSSSGATERARARRQRRTTATTPARPGRPFAEGAGEVIRVLPRGPNAAPREVVAASQRARLLEAVAIAVGEKGYGATTISDIVSRAGVSRKAFYQHFNDKLDCFLASYDQNAAILIAEARSAGLARTHWMERIQGAVERYAQVLADWPLYARAFLVEVLAAGPRARRHRDFVHGRFVELLRELYEDATPSADRPEHLPEELMQAFIGALNELVYVCLQRQGPEGLRTIAPSLYRVQSALMGGAVPAASRGSEARAARAG